MPLQRQYQAGFSRPNFSQGRCLSCQSAVTLDANVTFNNNDVLSCAECGANAPRIKLVKEAFALIDTIAWSLFGSDLYIWDEVQVPTGDYASYDLQALQAVKWQHHEVHPDASLGGRYAAEIYFFGGAAYLTVTDTQPASEQAVVSEVNVVWYRFGLSQQGTVPAWRQSLFGAATLVTTHPAAAVVLVAAGFESFFLESMRIAWRENQLDEASFERLSRRNFPLTSLIEWLPPAVRHPSLLDNLALHRKWKTLVNERRNDVVHRANVHLTSAEAMESMSSALDCICFIDEVALVRPHAYYRSEAGAQVLGEDD